MAKFKQRRTKGRTTQWPNLNEGQRDGQHNAKFKRRTKGRTTQWPNLNGRTKGQTTQWPKGRTTQWPNLKKAKDKGDGQHNGQRDQI